MAKQEVFYIGPGVFRFGDEDYPYGAKLPAEVPKETIESMIEKGKASHTVPSTNTAPAPAAAVDFARTAELQEQLAEATAAAIRNSDEIIRLQGELATAKSTIEAMEKAAQDGTARIAELQGELDASKATIEALTQQLTSPAESGAGSKK